MPTNSQDEQARSVPFANDPDKERDHAREWLDHVYQGDHAVQLTPRAVIAGMCIGGFMSVSNLYVGLKTGWGLGVTITACIIAYGVFRMLEVVIPAYRKRPFSMLENYTMSSAASAAGYMASAGLVSAIPALYLTTGRLLSWWELSAWLFSVSTLGVFMAIPLKRQLINIDQLAFPSGIATAETLRSMHATGGTAARKSYGLLLSGIVGALVPLCRDVGKWIPEVMPLGNFSRSQGWLKNYSIGLEGSLVMVAAGAIMGFRVGWSMLVGSLFFYGLLGPILVERELALPGYSGIVKWVLWPSTAMLVSSGLLSFALKWKTIVRSMRGLLTMFGPSSTSQDDPLAHIEVPMSIFVLGTSLSALACIVLGDVLFGIRWWMGLVAVLVTFLLSIVAARATGETDVTPIGAMGKITQLLYGVLAPTNLTTNLMTASITSGAASHAADLLTDLKSGYLLGGNPRSQVVSQLCGVVAGTLVSVPAYLFIVQRNPEVLNSDAMPAPSAKVWASVAQLLANGPGSLPAGTGYAIAMGIAVGIVLTLLEEFLPQHYRKYVPSATGLGIAGVIPAYNAIAMFFGAAVAAILAKVAPRTSDEHTVTVSSGLIAGETLMGVAIILVRDILWSK